MGRKKGGWEILLKALFAALKKSTKRPAKKKTIMARRSVQRSNRQADAAGYPLGLVGESNYQPAILKCREGEPVTLLREPDNPHGKNGRVIVAECLRGSTIGYVSNDSWLQDVIHDEGKGCAARILSISKAVSGHLGVVIDIELNDSGLGVRPFRRN